MNITNNTGATIAINRFVADWVKLSPSQKLDRLFLDGNEVWNISDNTPPSDIPTEGNWNNAVRTIAGDGTPRTFLTQFQNPLESGNYQVQLFFDNGCQVSGSVTLP